MNLNSTGTTTLGGTVNAASVVTDAGGTLQLRWQCDHERNPTYKDAVTLGADSIFATLIQCDFRFNLR